MDKLNPPNWFNIAEAELGQAEIKGNTDNQRILEYFKATDVLAEHDEVPWCAAFACWCLEQAGVNSPKRALAISFLDWGTELDKPIYGCIVVLKRTNNPQSGHVGFVCDETDLRLVVLGGNQGDKVSAAGFKKEDVLSYRWPSIADMA